MTQPKGLCLHCSRPFSEHDPADIHQCPGWEGSANGDEDESPPDTDSEFDHESDR